MGRRLCLLLAAWGTCGIIASIPQAQAQQSTGSGPMGAAYPYGYYAELPVVPPDPGPVKTTPDLAADPADPNKTAPGNIPQDPNAAPPPMPAAPPADKASDPTNAPKAPDQRPEPQEKSESLLDSLSGKASTFRSGPLPDSPAGLIVQEMRIGNYQRALQGLDRQLESNPEAYELEYLRAVSLVMLKRQAEAMTSYHKIIDGNARPEIKRLARQGLAKLEPR